MTRAEIALQVCAANHNDRQKNREWYITATVPKVANAPPAPRPRRKAEANTKGWVEVVWSKYDSNQIAQLRQNCTQAQA